jgi:glucose/arabinose dehydrogenase
VVVAGLAAVTAGLALTGSGPAASEQLRVRAWTPPLEFVAGIAYLPDGRALVTEKASGLIRVLERDGSLRPKPFARLG